MADKGKRAKQDNNDNVIIKPPTSDDRGTRAKQDNTDNISIKPPASDGRGTSIKLIMTM